MGKHFQQVFDSKAPENRDSSKLVSTDEFHAFSTGIKHFHEWAPKISGERGSSIKEAFFTAMFCIAPGLTGEDLHRATSYKQYGSKLLVYTSQTTNNNHNVSHVYRNLETGLKLFVYSEDVKTTVYKPRPDSCRVNDSTGLAVYINEVVSDAKSGRDRWRMLCQAIAITRIGDYYTAKDKLFCTSALYVTDKLQVEWYILYCNQKKARFI